MTDLQKLSQMIVTYKLDEISAFTEHLLDCGFSSEEILQEGILPGLQEIGHKFETQEIFIPEMLLAARTSKFAAECLRTRMDFQPQIFSQKMVLGTVQTDLHDIGKNLVATALRNAGIEVIDLGVDVPPEKFVRAVEQDEDVVLVGISALLSLTLPMMKKTVNALKKSKAADRITIFVGGAPVSAAFAKSIGADVYTESAFAAAEAARTILLRQEEQK